MKVIPRLLGPGLRSLGRRRLLKLAGNLLVGAGAGGWIGESRAAEDARISAPPADELWPANYPEQNVWGYAGKHSVLPGEPFDITLSTGPRLETIAGHVEIFRVGAKEAERRLIWCSRVVAVRLQPVTPTAAAIGTGWPPSVLDVATGEWKPGIYTADFAFRDSPYRDTNLFQIVVRNPKRAGDVLVKLATNTYQAYNACGEATASTPAALVRPARSSPSIAPAPQRFSSTTHT